MSYYDNPGAAQWNAPSASQGPPGPTPGPANPAPANNWDHQTSQVRANSNRWKAADSQAADLTLGKPAGANGPTAADEFAFSYQFDEVDRAHENLAKSGKMFAMGPRRDYPAMNPNAGFGPGNLRARPGIGPIPAMPAARPLSISEFGSTASPAIGPAPGFFPQRHSSTRVASEADQASRRLAAQRERQLRNMHTEQQFQRNTLATTAEPPFGTKPRTEEEARELIARQRSALYGEGAFAEKASYVDELGAVRTGVPIPVLTATSGLHGASPMTSLDHRNLPISTSTTATTTAAPIDPISIVKPTGPEAIHSVVTPTSSEPAVSNASPLASIGKSVFDSSTSTGPRTSSASSPVGGSPARDGSGLKSSIAGASVAPIGTRPSGTPVSTTNNMRAQTPMASPGSWGRNGSVWGQTSGLGTQASVWG